MSDPRNVADAKKVGQEKKHEGTAKKPAGAKPKSGSFENNLVLGLSGVTIRARLSPSHGTFRRARRTGKSNGRPAPVAVAYLPLLGLVTTNGRPWHYLFYRDIRRKEGRLVPLV